MSETSEIKSFFSKSRLFLRKTFPQSCHVCPFGRYFTLFRFFRFFFSRCEFVHIGDSLFLHIFLFSRTKELLTSCRCAQRTFAARVVFGRRRPSLVACWRRFFYYDDRLKFRAIITMEIFNTIRSAVFSLSLSLSICARRVKIAPFESEE